MVQQRLQRFEETEGAQWERVEKLDSRPELETEQRTLPDRQSYKPWPAPFSNQRFSKCILFDSCYGTSQTLEIAESHPC